MEVMKAAELLEAGYAGAFGSSVEAKPHAQDGVQAYLLADGTLVVPGTNELSDWTRYNLLLFSWRTAKATGGFHFHSGFLKHANAVLHWVRGKNVTCITGHSLGAAGCQILGAILNKPTINFAAPKVSLKKYRYANEDKILNFNRTDDRVTKIPRWRFRHLGRVETLDPQGPHAGGDHKIKFYKELLVLDRYAGLPQEWG